MVWTKIESRTVLFKTIRKCAFNLIRLPEILKFLNAIKNQLDKDLKDVLDVNKDVATINVSIAM